MYLETGESIVSSTPNRRVFSTIRMCFCHRSSGGHVDETVDVNLGVQLTT